MEKDNELQALKDRIHKLETLVDTLQQEKNQSGWTFWNDTAKAFFVVLFGISFIVLIAGLIGMNWS